MPYPDNSTINKELEAKYLAESLRLEAVIACVGFDEILDHTLSINHPQLDTAIVVTTNTDKLTQEVCHKHGVICAQTDLFSKNGRKINKGAALNAGMSRFQYHGWRMVLSFLSKSKLCIWLR